jgi:hypothetical protein
MALTIKGNGGKFLESNGTLTTDRFGLSTATAIWFQAGNTAPEMPSSGAPHPYWTELKCEGVTVKQDVEGFRLEGRYAGIYGPTLPVYELSESMSEEPIETHPDFKDFATDANGYKPHPDDGSFVGFVRRPEWDLNLDDPTPREITNPLWIGVRSYLVPGATFRKTYVTINAPSPGTLGSISTPEGAPSYSDRTWLYAGMAYERRADVYVIREEWRLSGPRGWNTIIYTG